MSRAASYTRPAPATATAVPTPAGASDLERGQQALEASLAGSTTPRPVPLCHPSLLPLPFLLPPLF